MCIVNDMHNERLTVFLSRVTGLMNRPAEEGGEGGREEGII